MIDRRKRALSAVIDMRDLKNELPTFSTEHLIDIVYHSAQCDLLLWKALNAYIGIIQSQGEFANAKRAIDYGLSIEQASSSKDKGHDFIIYEMMRAIEVLLAKGYKKSALKMARYIHDEALSKSIYLEDDWNWALALEELNKKISLWTS